MTEALLYVFVFLGVCTGHESGVLTMLLLLLLLFLESIQEMIHIRECFIFFISADILMGCARQKVTISIATEHCGDAASHFFFPYLEMDQRYM